MHSVGLKTLKNKLSEYVSADAAPGERLLGELLREGLLALAKVPPRTRLPRRKPAVKIDELLRELDDSRAGP